MYMSFIRRYYLLRILLISNGGGVKIYQNNKFFNKKFFKLWLKSIMIVSIIKYLRVKSDIN